jgi:hypothetical protein
LVAAFINKLLDYAVIPLGHAQIHEFVAMLFAPVGLGRRDLSHGPDPFRVWGGGGGGAGEVLGGNGASM